MSACSRRVSICLLVLLLTVSGSFAAAQTLDVSVIADVGAINGEDLSGALHTQMMQQVDEALKRRAVDYEAIKTPEQIAEYQQKMRDHLMSELGQLPERTPLEANVVGKVDREGYTVEKVIFQSQPGHFVTALYYLPDGEGPFPGVLVPCGHSDKAKGYDSYQRASALLALNGMAVLCYDPIEQGERMQQIDENGNYREWGTRSHCRIGLGSTLVGRNTVTFRVWDGLRAMDYLASRPEVDASRLGCTGNSGGGTMTAYLMAIDKRIQCAAPACYLTNYDRLLNTIGPQDAEQHFHDQIGTGFDHAEFIGIRAPKPTLICCATEDFFDISGTWTTFREAKRLYSRMGYAERVDLVETDQKHGFSIQLREGAARWMSRWLRGVDEPIIEPEIEVLAPEDYQCTPDGQVMLMDGAVDTYAFNRRLNEALRAEREALWTDKAKGLAEMQRITGIRKSDELPSIKTRVVRSDQLLEMNVEQLLLEGEGRVPLPAAMLVPSSPTGEACLYLHEAGKKADEAAVLELVNKGVTVLAVDLPGIGETQPKNGGSYASFLGQQWQDAYIAYMLGTSMLAMRAEEVSRCAAWLKDRMKDIGPEDGRKPLRVVAIGRAGPPALHAMALEPTMADHLTLKQSLTSWESVLDCPECPNRLANVVHAALTAYDLPDLAGCIQDRLAIVEPVDAMGEPTTP